MVAHFCNFLGRLQLTQSKCIPALLYGLEAYPTFNVTVIFDGARNFLALSYQGKKNLINS